MKDIKKEDGSKSKAGSPYLSKRVYQNYAQSMKVKNLKRKKNGLKTIQIRTYEEWSGG